MKNKRLIYPLGGAVLLILALLVLILLLPRLQRGPIRIKTALKPEEVVGEVKLSSGTLHFKTETEVYAELTPEERNACKPKPKDYLPETVESFAVKEEDISRVLNLDPAQWRVPDRFAPSYAHFAGSVSLSPAEDAELAYSDDVLYSRECRSDEGTFVYIEAALPGRRWIRSSELSADGPSVQQVKAVYGVLDSRIGDMPLSVLHPEYAVWDRLFEAYFVAGNAAYFVRSNGMNQQEFIELLISIYEAPRPVTEDALGALQAIAQNSMPREAQGATLCFYREPTNITETRPDKARTVWLTRKHRAGIPEIEELKRIVDGIDSWTLGLVRDKDLTADGYLSLWDGEYEHALYFSYSGNYLFYTVLSMDPETEKLEAARYFAPISQEDMAFIRSIQDTKNGFSD